MARRKKRIMIVEDNELNTKLFHDLLIANFPSVEILCTRDFRIVMAELRKKYDVILMDIQLPDVSVLQIIRWIRERRHSVPIIVITAFAMKGDEEIILLSGANEYITKPVSVAALLRAVHSYLI
jgi:two-component system cell cycle response regulator DivK